MKRSFWLYLMNVLVILFIVIMGLTLITLPFIVDKYAELTGKIIDNSLLVKIFLYLSAVPFTVLLIMVKKLVNNILRKDPFSQSSITALNIISICAFSDFILYAFGTAFLLKDLISLVFTIAAFMIGITSLILSQLVKSAIAIKQENDLTI
jgi:hypothetical protein